MSLGHIENRLLALENRMKQAFIELEKLRQGQVANTQSVAKAWSLPQGGGGNGGAVWFGYTTSIVTAAGDELTPGYGSVVIQSLTTPAPSPVLTDGPGAVTAYWNGAAAIASGTDVAGGFDQNGNPLILSGDC